MPIDLTPRQLPEASEARVLLQTRGLRAERQSKSAAFVTLLVTSGVVNVHQDPHLRCRV